MRTRIYNEFLSVEIESLGAELKRIYRSDLGIEYLWSGDPKIWNRSAPTLFPIVGKLKDDFFLHKGGQYNLSQHGFARDLEFVLDQYNNRSAEFILNSNEASLRDYPWEFRLKNVYTVQGDRLLIEQQVTNLSDHLMYYSIGAHPAFRWPLLPNTEKEEYQMVFNKDTELSRTFLDQGLLSNRKEQIVLSNNSIQFSDQLFDDDALILDQLRSTELTYRHQILDNGITLGWNDSPYLGIWSKQKADFICIEPWQGIADAIDHDHDIAHKRGIRNLQPGDSNTFSWWIQLF